MRLQVVSSCQKHMTSLSWYSLMESLTRALWQDIQQNGINEAQLWPLALVIVFGTSYLTNLIESWIIGTPDLLGSFRILSVSTVISLSQSLGRTSSSSLCTSWHQSQIRVCVEAQDPQLDHTAHTGSTWIHEKRASWASESCSRRRGRIQHFRAWLVKSPNAWWGFSP